MKIVLKKLIMFFFLNIIQIHLILCVYNDSIISLGKNLKLSEFLQISENNFSIPFDQERENSFENITISNNTQNIIKEHKQKVSINLNGLENNSKEFNYYFVDSITKNNKPLLLNTNYTYSSKNSQNLVNINNNNFPII